MVERESTSQIWNDAWQEHSFDYWKTNTALVGIVLEVMGGSVEGRHILEVGSGRARNSACLARLGARVCAVDFSPVAIGLSKRLTSAEGVEIIPCLADARSLPFHENAFDLTLSEGLIEHFQPPDLLIKEQVRVVKPGGYVLIEVPQLFSIQAVVKFLAMTRGTWPYGWERNYTERQLKELATRNGLKIISSYGWDSSIPVTFGTGMGNLVRKLAGRKEIEKGSGAEELPPDEVVIGRPETNKTWLARHVLNCIGIVGQKK